MGNTTPKRILVTGAAGFIGCQLCRRLVSEEVEIVGLDNINSYYDPQLKYDRLAVLGIEAEKAARWIHPAPSTDYANFTFVRMDLEDREHLPALFARYHFDTVVNLAAQAGVRYSLKNPESYIDSNIVGFLTLLEACRHHEVEHLVYASSSSVYGANKKIPFAEEDRVDYPVSLYAATKKSNELMAYTYSHLYALPTTGLRFFTVYGPWGRPDMAPVLFASAMAENRPINVFNHGDMSRDFTYIDDILDGICITLNYRPDKDQERPFYNLFNIGNGAPVDLMKFIETLEKAFGKEVEKKMLPMQPGDVPQTYADTTALNRLGYQSRVSIEEGVKKFVDWFKTYYPI